LTLPWAFLRFVGRTVRRLFTAIGVLAVLAAAAVIFAYVGFEEIVEKIDARYADRIDAELGIDRNTIARLRDPTYFAQQSSLVTEDLKTVACISSPEHRILIHDAANIPPLFVKAILASEDKNFFEHEGVDKAAILRAFAMHLLHESRSGASTPATPTTPTTGSFAPERLPSTSPVTFSPKSATSISSNRNTTSSRRDGGSPARRSRSSRTGASSSG
jgi:membrane peptidoglycan carboxypeptidase